MSSASSRRLALLSVFLLVAGMAAGEEKQDASVEIGDKAPGFANLDLKGTYVYGTGMLGKKWVILNFFATFCEPCKEELPALENLQTAIGAEKLRVVVFATDTEKDKIKEYFVRRPTSLTVLYDNYKTAYQRYNKADDGLPVSFLVAPDGMIVMKRVPSSVSFIAEMEQTILAAK